MSGVILKIENLSKQYRLGTVGTGTVGHDLNRWWHNVRGKEDPFLKVGEVNDRSIKGNSEYVWALKDINFEVKKGEVLGIIGKNGAGKSTLLKILSKVTGPTTGSLKSKGRIASLLEVGTGFHPELTGRENIYLNGAILGMTKAEINAKLDEIIEFSGCERYIDTPVKRYSSGMTVRLAFAVAAFLEPDILVIDEVLAVGDAEFQKKAIGKMQDISRGDGRTVLFVSHNMAAVKSLCTRCVVLENGGVFFNGKVDEALDVYLNMNVKKKESHFVNLEANEHADVLEVSMLNSKKEITSVYAFKDKIFLKIKLRCTRSLLRNGIIGFRVKDQLERAIFTSEKDLNNIFDKKGEHTIIIELPDQKLVPNDYNVIIGYHIPNQEIIRYLDNIVTFRIEETGTEFYKYHGKDFGCVILDCKWGVKLN